MNNRNQSEKRIRMKGSVRESFYREENIFQGKFQFSKIPSRKSIFHFHTFFKNTKIRKQLSIHIPMPSPFILFSHHPHRHRPPLYRFNYLKFMLFLPHCVKFVSFRFFCIFRHFDQPLRIFLSNICTQNLIFS